MSNAIIEELYEKNTFVSTELQAPVKRIDPDIVSVGYSYTGTTGTEVVTVNYRDDHAIGVNVTADSLCAITKDVLRHIA
ncbi:MAG: hypothetical protein ACI4JF_09060 [Oscillospiraceae bacterium]